MMIPARTAQLVPLILSGFLSLILNDLVIGQVTQTGQGTLTTEVAQTALSANADWQTQVRNVVNEAIQAGDLPGAVIGIWRDGKWVMREAIGSRQIEPTVEPMTLDTVFDLASLTKPVATATSTMILAEQGKIALDAPVSRYLPDFVADGRETVLVRHLLIHGAGLIPDNALGDYQHGIVEAWRRLFTMAPRSPVGTKFVYSDVGFLLLGKIVEQVSGQSLDVFAQQKIFQPLKMLDTGYQPTSDKLARVAPTEPRDGNMLKGIVHDPRAALLNGVAGHAGLFSTLDDLAIYAQMLLAGGKFQGQTILQRDTVQRMTMPRQVEQRDGFGTITRTFGWDHHSTYSYNSGDCLSSSAFGHGGFTGTVFWIDPDANHFFIFLSNRLHPDGKGNVNRLAAKVSAIAIEHLNTNAATASSEKNQAKNSQTLVLPGIDVLSSRGYRDLIGKRVGLITNHTGQSASGKRTVEILAKAPGVNLVALFSPEHGIQGKLDISKIGDSRDPEFNLPVFSLYGETRRPQTEHLEQIDCLVFDIQDIGSRFYTYIATMKECMLALSGTSKSLIVLDRPNPIGPTVRGSLRDEGRESFVACHNVPVQHGMTSGEMALLFHKELNLNLDLIVVPVRNWHRDLTGEFTGLWWVDPSPNMRNLLAARLYPGIGLLETTNLSVGRGTERPFEWIGAPWLDAQTLAQWFNSQGIPGCRAIARIDAPKASKFANQSCPGIQLIVTDTAQLDALRVGISLAIGLRHLHRDQWECERMDVLLTNKQVLQAIMGGKTWDEIDRIFRADEQQFQTRRQSVLLYD